MYEKNISIYSLSSRGTGTQQVTLQYGTAARPAERFRSLAISLYLIQA